MFSPRVLAVLGIPVFIVLLAIAALGLHLSQDEKASKDSVDHSYKVIGSTKDVLEDVQSAQIATQRFESKRDPSALRGVYGGLDEAPKDLKHFGELTKDNPRQQERVAKLLPLLEAWRADVQKEVRAAKSSPKGVGGEPRELLNEALDHVDQIHALLTQAVNDEDRLLARREATARGLERSTLTTALLGALLALAILGAATLLLLRSNTRLAQSEAMRARQAAVLQDTLDGIRDGIAVFEADMTLAAFNSNFFLLGDFPMSLAIVGTPLARFRDAERGRPEKIFPSESLCEAESRASRNIVISERNLEVYETSVPNEGALVALTGVTARVRSEETLRRAQ